MADDGISNAMRKVSMDSEMRALSRALIHDTDHDVIMTGSCKLPKVPTRLRLSTCHEELVHAQLEQLPTWREQITFRGIVLGAILGTLFSLIISRLNLGFGIQPSMNIAGGLLGFALLKFTLGASASILQYMPWLPASIAAPLTAQEVNFVQTFCTASSTIAGIAGFGNYLVAMDRRAYDSVNGGGDRITPGNRLEDIYEPELVRVIPYLLCICLIGVFGVVLLRKAFILDFNLPFPSGTAAGILVNSFFTKDGEETVAKQMSALTAAGVLAFLWDCSNYLLTWPVMCLASAFGCKHYKWHVDWSINLVGSGMLCPPSVNWSMLFGALCTWGVLWPYIDTRGGVWYDEGLDGVSSSSFEGGLGYRVFICVALLIGDGCYNGVRVLWVSAADICKRRRQHKRWKVQQSDASASSRSTSLLPVVSSTYASSPFASDTEQQRFSDSGEGDGYQGPQVTSPFASAPVVATAAGGEDERTKRKSRDRERGGGGGHHAPSAAVRRCVSVDETPTFQADVSIGTLKETTEQRELRRAVFLLDAIPTWLAVLGYVAFMALGTLVIPRIYHQIKWYQVLVCYCLAAVLAVPDGYGVGLCDWDMCSTYGKFAVFIFAAWGGCEGGVITGLVACGIVMAGLFTASSLLTDFRTGYLVLSSPKALFVAQVGGGILGSITAPLTFFLFWNTGRVQVPNGPYPAPYAQVFRAMAILGTQGISALPMHCTTFMAAAFGLAIVLNVARSWLPPAVATYVPIPMAMAIPLITGAHVPIQMCLGGALMQIWRYWNLEQAELLGAAVASGLIVGDGLFSVPGCLLSMLQFKIPLLQSECVLTGYNCS